MRFIWRERAVGIVFQCLVCVCVSVPRVCVSVPLVCVCGVETGPKASFSFVESESVKTQVGGSSVSYEIQI